MRQTTDTRSRLIEATIEAIVAGGEASVRVQNIAAASDVKEPSVYHFFKNRVELVEAAQVERYRRSYFEMFVPFKAVVDMTETKEEFQTAIRKLFNFMYVPERHEVRSVRYNVIGSAQASPQLAEEIKRMNREVAQEFSDLIRGLQKKKWVRQDLDTLAFAYWVMGQINGRVLAEMDPDHVALSEWNKVSIEAVLRVLE
jgi:AcrR family transcriptional regulator